MMKQRGFLRLEELEQRNTPSTVTNMDFAVSGTFIDSCTGENIAYQGTLHVAEQVTFDNAGGMHVKLHENFQDVTGVGQTSGLQYHIPGAANLEENFTPG